MTHNYQINEEKIKNYNRAVRRDKIKEFFHEHYLIIIFNAITIALLINLCLK